MAATGDVSEGSDKNVNGDSDNEIGLFYNDKNVFEPVIMRMAGSGIFLFLR